MGRFGTIYLQYVICFGEHLIRIHPRVASRKDGEHRHGAGQRHTAVEGHLCEPDLGVGRVEDCGCSD